MHAMPVHLQVQLMKVYIVRSTSQKLCTPPQTSAKLLALDTTENITIGINLNVITIVAINITVAATRITVAIVITTVETVITILVIATTAIDTTIVTGMDIKISINT